jgi:hypothetical protein
VPGKELAKVVIVKSELQLSDGGAPRKLCVQHEELDRTTGGQGALAVKSEFQNLFPQP